VLELRPLLELCGLAVALPSIHTGGVAGGVRVPPRTEGDVEGCGDAAGDAGERSDETGDLPKGLDGGVEALCFAFALAPLWAGEGVAGAEEALLGVGDPEDALRLLPLLPLLAGEAYRNEAGLLLSGFLRNRASFLPSFTRRACSSALRRKWGRSSCAMASACATSTKPPTPGPPPLRRLSPGLGLSGS